ncbi:hypothetical protein RND81_14G193300 [Saponaria officinalis]|uniref:Uncharacterized protein n=1 Tax=Saponaria officinalis TaxID=3572 RepID=A0AAW1GVM6_SAPOF
MDPCQFLKIIVGNLAIKFPPGSNLNPTSSFYCRIKYKDFPPQYAAVPQEGGHHGVSACFNMSNADVEKLLASKKNASRKHSSTSGISSTILKIDVYFGVGPSKGCGFGAGGKLVGRVSVPLELSKQVLEAKTSTVVQNGWVIVGEKKSKGLNLNSSQNPQVYVSVKVKPDPRFVFAFEGEPECSPQVFLVQGNIEQPVFSCKFSCRQPADWNSRSSSDTSTSRSWLSTLKVDKDHDHHHRHHVKERKGWSITIHDLSGSPVAAASMVTPFVPSQGSDWVSRSNPGVWLIMRPGERTWKPWGRLESWRERDGPGSDAIGHRLEIIPDVGVPASVMGPNTLAQGSVRARSGGNFSINIATGPSPSTSPNSSIDFGSWSGSGSASSSASEPGPGPATGWWPGMMYKGFVMSTTVGGEGKGSRPRVEVGSHHVTCAEDAAVFVALAAAMDLSMDACRPFSHKLRKELRQNSGDFVL